MLHAIPPDRHGPLGAPMARAIESCVHCGFCLAACPTYRELGQEMDTPRGRIVLMKEVLEGNLPWEAAQPHIDRCLGCLACEPACPSGVPYRDLISPFRAVARAHFPRPFAERLRRALMNQIVPYPERFDIAARLGAVARKFQALLPARLRPMLDLLPPAPPGNALPRWPHITPATRPRRARVALLTGCAQQVLAPDINAATISVLARQGVEVVIPENQGCCGGLAWHGGELAAAREFARRNLRAFPGPTEVDAILTNAAGCGSAMHEYHLILRGTPDEAAAGAFRHRVMDVTVFLARLGLREAPGPLPTPDGTNRPVRAAYHDACHLANAQNVRAEPRALLRAIPNLDLVELPDPHLCCGSAGSYNLDQPEIAGSLGRQKATTVAATGADLVATGNIGCLIQLISHLERLGRPIPVRHTLQILRDACGA